MDQEFIQSNKKLHVYISDCFKNNQSFFIGRLSCVEPIITHQIITNTIWPGYVRNLDNIAGIHCKSLESLKKWSMQYYDAMKNSTLLGIWEKEGGVYKWEGPAQEFFMKVLKPDTYWAPSLMAFNYYKESGPSWIDALQNKKILVISPFVNSIKSQIDSGRMGKIFKNHPDWLKGCTFIYHKPPVTHGGNHEGKEWHETFEEFQTKVDLIEDYDVALLSCGGYGMLIANHIFKTKKKSVIYVGGALQLFFGIMGGRWETDTGYADNMKKEIGDLWDNWIHPCDEEKPANFKTIEGGSYW